MSKEENNTGKIILRPDSELWKEVKRYAIDHDLTLHESVIQLITKGLQND